jgi:hypothetical protein
MSVIPDTQGSTKRRTVVRPGLHIKQDSISKITKTKRAEGMAQVIKCLYSKRKALSSTPSSAKKKTLRKTSNNNKTCKLILLRQFQSAYSQDSRNKDVTPFNE